MVEGGDKPEKTTESKSTADARPPTLYELDEKLAKDSDAVEPKVSLTRLVVWGVFLVVLLGSLLFVWVAWVETHQAFWSTAWVDDVTGDGWFNAARTSATFLAVVGIGGAAVVGYRRQQTLELTRLLEQRKHILGMLSQQTAADQAKTASEQLALDSQKFQLDRERQRTERERELRERFAVVVGQLDTQSLTIQSAGMYALVALADDWASLGNLAERQVCVDLFCAYLRANDDSGEHDDERQIEAIQRIRRHENIRVTGAAIFRRQLALIEGESDAESLWRSPMVKLDLQGADLGQLDLTELDFSNAGLANAFLVETNLRGSDLTGADLTGADLTRSQMVAASLPVTQLVGAKMNGSSLIRANFVDADLTNANLIKANISGANFSGAAIRNADLTGVNFISAPKFRPKFDQTGGLHDTKHDERFAKFFAKEIQASRDVDEGLA